jgi:hypothetical protein
MSQTRPIAKRREITADNGLDNSARYRIVRFRLVYNDMPIAGSVEILSN